MISASQIIIINNCNFSKNVAELGASIYIEFRKKRFQGPHEIEISKCNFTSNHAKYGSAIYFDQKS